MPHMYPVLVECPPALDTYQAWRWPHYACRKVPRLASCFTFIPWGPSGSRQGAAETKSSPLARVTHLSAGWR